MNQENTSAQENDMVENQTAANESETTTPEEVLSVEEQLQSDLAKEKDKFLRLFAEFENYKKRTAKERMEFYKTASEDVLLALLPVLDDLDRAMPQILESKEEGLVTGVQLIQDKLKTILVSKGLQEIDLRSGDAFNVDFAEAITSTPAPSDKLKGKIVDVVEKGYKLGDKVIRFSKVVIGN